MRLRFRLFLLALIGTAWSASAQTFDLDQFDQLFRPRLRVEGRWMPATGLKEDPGTFEDRTLTGILTFPIHRKWSVGVQADLTAKSFKELLQHSVRIRAAQVMGNVRFGSRQVIAEDLFGDTRQLYTVSVGALGVSLTRKLRVLFWSANVNVSEEDRTFDQAVPRVTGLIGKLHVKGLRRNFFYGLAASYSDGFALPIPFLGGTAPLGDALSLQYVLPLQAAMVWKADGRTRVQGGIGLDGSRTGIALGLDDARYNLSVAGLRAFLGVRHKLNGHFQLRAEASYLPRQRLLLGDHDLDGLAPAMPLQQGFAVTAGISILFGDSVLERIIEEVVR
ncbi:MAG TPA: hypothetical protein VHL57_05420 [Flavobacteriales bacterium]|nr:hypothetical protein [Flavobacteriales bacterium]